MKNLKRIKTYFSKERVFILLVAIAVFCVQLRHLHELYAPWVYDDEIGYWANAAFFAGKNWSGIMKYCQYYSFGYSLLLVPLFFLNLSPVYMYKAAIVLNAFISLIPLGCSLGIIKKIFPKQNYSKYICIMLASVLNACFLFQVQTTWTELLLYTLTWGIAYSLVSYFCTQRWKYIIIVSFLSVYSYLVHQRMLGIIAASLLTIILWMIISKKVNIKHLLFFMVLFLIGLLLNSEIKQYLQVHLWKIGSASSVITSSNVNDYGSQLIRLKMIFSSVESFINFIEQFLAKIFYFGRASFLLIYIIIYSWIKDTITIIKNKFNKELGIEFWYKNIVLFSTLSMILITTIFTVDGTRNDAILYGRYAEPIIGILILEGIYIIVNWKESKQHFFCLLTGAFFLEIVLGLLVKRDLWNITSETFGANIISFVRYIVGNEIYLARMTIDIFVIYVAFLCISFFKKKEIFLAITAFLLIGFAYFDAEKGFDIYNLYWQNQKKEIIDISSRYISDDIDNIYYILSDSFNQNGNKNTLQFLFPEKNVVCVDDEDEIVDDTGIIFACTYDSNIEQIKEKYYYVAENTELVVMKTKKN